MREHRLIEQILSPLEIELRYISHQRKVHPSFIYSVVDFFRTYADKYHHGKEEDILFLELKGKELVPEHQQILSELEEEHRFARRTVGELEKATEQWRKGELSELTIVADDLRKLIELYPRHIEKEDKHFFFPILDYFTKEERENLLQVGYEFDKQFTNNIYKERMKTILEHT